MTALILQARLDSARLPKKTLLPLGDRPLISVVMAALRVIAADVHVLACTADSLKAFRQLADREGFEVFAGSKDDVLKRYCDVIRHYSPDRVIRATGDNPFVFADAAEEINRQGIELEADYAAFIELPYGAGVESVNAAALLKAERDTQKKAEREHVCPYLYNNPELFKIHRPFAPAKWRFPSIRVTVDTNADYEMARRLEGELFRRWGVNGPERFAGGSVINACQGVV